MTISFQDYSFEEIIRDLPCWSWREIKFGYLEGIITARDIVYYAAYALEDNPQYEFIIAVALADPFTDSVTPLLEPLLALESEESTEDMQNKWVYAILCCLYKKRDKYKSVSLLLDSIYADFDYPACMHSLVSYMPYDGSDGYNLEDRWKAFLRQGYRKYVKSVDN